MQRSPLLLAVLALTAFVATAQHRPARAAADRPNIVWVLGDDLGVELGCYGDKVARTPNLDRLATQGTRFTRAYTTAPVCSPSRSAMITGMYQTTIGAHNHRSHRKDGYHLPEGVRPMTDRLRELGYFTVNQVPVAPGVRASGKTDFNFTAENVYDGDDWAKRAPGQPFFAHVNFTEPHRGPAWKRAREQAELTDPAKVVLPPKYPDDPVVRDDWANYLDAVHLLDTKVGALLKRLEDEGLAQNTIVFFFGDNGRCHVWDKQWLYEGGFHIPLIVRWPGQVPAGAVRDDLISAIDITATTLKLAGVTLPAGFQGQPFLGEGVKKRPYLFGARDRCDETVDRIRSVRDARFKYIRNYMPERPYTQPNKYKEDQYPALAVMKRLHAEGKLTPVQERFFAPQKPAEELYDLETDPEETHNLAADPAHAARLQALRQALDDWIRDTHDQGATPEKPGTIE